MAGKGRKTENRESGFGDGSFNNEEPNEVENRIAEALVEEGQDQAQINQNNNPFNLLANQPAPGQQVQPVAPIIPTTQPNPPPSQPPVTMATPKITLDTYSGHAQNMAPNRGPVEPYTASEWLKRLNKVGKSCGWTDEMKASNASLALAPGSPAHVWYQLNNEDESLEDWDAFQKKLKEEFDPEESPMARMGLLRTIRFRNGDTVQHYENSMNLNFSRFSKGLDDSWVKPKFAGARDCCKAHRKEVQAEIMDYMKQGLFLNGLPEEMVGRVAETKANTLKDMSEAAKDVEKSVAAKSTVRSHRISALQEGEKEDPEPPEGNKLQEGLDKILAFMEKKDTPGSKSSGGTNANDQKGGENGKKKRRDRDLSKVGCYYCLQYSGHLSNGCSRRDDDRKKGIWRPTVRDKPMREEEYYKLPSEIKLKGKQILKDMKEQSTVAGIQHQHQDHRPHPHQGWNPRWAPPQSQPDQDEWTESTWTRYYQGNDA